MNRPAMFTRMRPAALAIAGPSHVHHIASFAEHPELRLEPTNLTTLCVPCHHDAHRKEVVR